MKRRAFVKRATLSSFATIIGTELVFGTKILNGYVPLALQDPDPFKMFNKHPEMVVLNDKPWNIEAQAHLLDDRVTPNSCMFVRNNGLLPEGVDAKSWKLTIDGESVTNKKEYTLSELKSKFNTIHINLLLSAVATAVANLTHLPKEINGPLAQYIVLRGQVLGCEMY